MTGRRQLLRFSCIAILLFSVTRFAPAQNASRRLLDPPEVTYPPIAKAAKVGGDVVVQYVVTEEGSVRDVRVVSGPEMLRGAATASVLHWRFAAGDMQEKRSTIRFVAANGQDYVDYPAKAPVTKTDDDGVVVAVTAQLGAYKTRSECPPEAGYVMPSATAPNDWVEVERTGCYGSCPSYVLRVNRDGTVRWTGRAFVSKKGAASGKVTPERAVALIEKLNSRAFWSACGDYSRNITDMPGNILRANIDGLEKTVVDYADAAPAEIQDFENEIDKVAGSQRWIKR